MYLDHFGLKERPFSITPDPRFLYMSARHREALAHLLYGLGEGGGFVQLTGEVGTGKTTICRCLLEQVPDSVDIAMVLNPKVTATELIATVCDELGITYPAETTSIKTLIDVLNRYLLDAHAAGRRTVLIIDEAQNLSADVLEQVRLLTNLETNTQKLLQIILIGQPELRDLLARDDLRQLAQRVTARYHLEPISREEADAYMRHRLQICGNSRSLFTAGAIDRIQQLSGGIPRLINVICDRALLGAYVEGKAVVDRDVVKKAAREVLAENRKEVARRSLLPWVVSGLVMLALLALAFLYRPWGQADAPVDTPPVVTAPPPDAVAVVPETPAQPVDPPPAETLARTETELPSQVVAGAEPVDVAALLQSADSSWYRAAWTGLLKLWAVDLPLEVKPDFCDFALEYGLLCSIEQGNWNTVRHFNRPAILKLSLPGESKVPVLLQSLDGQIAQLGFGVQTLRVDKDLIDSYWYGEYTLLLQAPPNGNLFMKTGSRGPDVAWLREQLEIAQGVKLLASDPQLFDAELRKQVLEFQRSRGLHADGVVGKNTLIQLNSSAGREGVPVLQPAVGE